MSIEALIQANTEALLANTEAVKLLTATMAGGVAVKETKVAKEDVKTVSDLALAEPVRKKEKPVRKKEKPEEVKVTVVGGDEADKLLAAAMVEEPTPVQYETVRALVLKLAPTQREKIKALNATHGLNNAKDMLSNPEDFTSVKDQAKLEAYYADLQALEG